MLLNLFSRYVKYAPIYWRTGNCSFRHLQPSFQKASIPAMSLSATIQFPLQTKMISTQLLGISQRGIHTTSPMSNKDAGQQACPAPPKRSPGRKSERKEPDKVKVKVGWLVEQFGTVAMLICIPLIFFVECKPLEVLILVMAVWHSHKGMYHIVEDYLQPQKIGSVIPRVFKLLLLVISACMLTGGFNLITEDVGIAAGVKRMWSIKGGPLED